MATYNGEDIGKREMVAPYDEPVANRPGRLNRPQNASLDLLVDEGWDFTDEARLWPTPSEGGNPAARVAAQAVEMLPPPLKSVFELVHVRCLSYREAAEELGVSYTTVHKREHRIRAAVVAALKLAGLQPDGEVTE